jgi:hypothetical protein
MKQTYVIDGGRFSTLEEFFEEVSRVLAPDCSWGHNLDAFKDTLRGGFGTTEGGFLLLRQNSETSRQNLGYPETVRQLRLRLERRHSTNRRRITRELLDAERCTGPTVFDWLKEIIGEHGPSGTEAEEGVELELA